MSMHSLKHAALALALTSSAFGCASANLDPQVDVDVLAHEDEGPASSAPSKPAAPSTPSTTTAAPRAVDIPVTLRGTGSATIRVTVFEAAAGEGGKTVLAIPGLSEAGSTFGPLASALGRQPAFGVRRVLGLDLVGHGGSSLPKGVVFGELTIDDNVGVVADVITALQKLDLAPSVLIAHSMGGLTVQGLQERLLAAGSSLAKQGISRTILLAPVPAHGRPWTMPPGDTTSQFIKADATLGAYLELPPEVFIASAFSTTKGTVATNAPSAAEVTARGYSALEPASALLQLVEAPIQQPGGGTITIPRPSVRAGAFGPSSGTRVSVLSFSEDTLVPAANLPDLAQHLSGDAAAHIAVVGPNAVHSSFISDPDAVIEALRSTGI